MSDITLTAAQIALVYPEEAEVFDMIAAVALTAGQAVYQTTAGKAGKADANAGSGAEKFRGIALTAAGAGQAVSVLKRGHAYGFAISGLAYDAAVYLSDTVGALADAPSTTNPVQVGRVVALPDNSLTKTLYIDAPWGKPAAAAARIFVSAEQTGTGSAQNVAHGLASTPYAVLIAPTDLTPATVGQYAVTEGAHDATNVVVTVTTGKKFKVIAFAA